jgi:hypothetical protein
MSRKVLELADQLAREKWRSSGLTDEDAARLHLESLSAEQTASLGPNFQAAASLYIPYFDASGARTDFFRVRYLGQLPGFAGAVQKPQKYDQPAKTLNEVYQPPLLNKQWREIYEDITTALYITEGELKSAAGCVHGLATIGLGGVDVWRASKRGLSLLPTLDEITWRERSVYVVYDSDAATNHHVVGAQLRLAKELSALGAYIHIVSLPAAENGGKQGLDDYLLVHGKEEFEKLVEGAQFFPEAAALWELNTEVAYVTDPGLLVVRSTGQRVSAASFVQHAYSTWHYQEQKASAKGTAWVEKKTAPKWLEWPERYTLKRMTYAPGQPQITANQEWNSWPGWGVQPKKGTILPWNWLLEYIFKGNRQARTWFEQWCAYPLQHPGKKLFTSSVLWSVFQGTGKTLLGRTLMRIYGQNASEIQESDLSPGFNEWAVNKQFVLGEEVASGNRKSTADRIKSMITQEQIHIKEKYIPAYYMPDCINYMFTSNHPDALFLEDTDRRFFVHEIIGPPDKRSNYQVYDVWYKGDGASYLFEHLLQIDTDDFDPMGPAPMTTAKEEMIADSKSDVANWVSNLKIDTQATLVHLGEKIASQCDLFNNAQLLRAYDPTNEHRVSAVGLGKELKRAGFRQLNDGSPIRTKMGLQKLYVIRNTDKWLSAPLQEAANHYEKFTEKF